MVAALELRGVTKRFAGGGGAMTAVADLTFTIAPREFLAVVGPSGCGKSTILNMVAGLDRPSDGEIRIDDARVEGPSARVGFMLQKDLLLPWRSIQRNVEFGLEARGVAGKGGTRSCRRSKSLTAAAPTTSGRVARNWPSLT